MQRPLRCTAEIVIPTGRNGFCCLVPCALMLALDAGAFAAGLLLVRHLIRQRTATRTVASGGEGCVAARMRYTAVVAGVEEARGRDIAFDLLRLRDVADAEGQPFPGAPYLTFGAQVRRLDLQPGDTITFVAHVEALDEERSYLGRNADAPLRLARPAKVARV